MKMLRRLSMVTISAAVAAVALAAPASATEMYGPVVHPCGVNYRCSITTNNSQGSTWHRINNVYTGTWPTAGAHSTSRAVPAGYAEAAASTSGTFSYKSSSCFCPGGVSCGV